MKAIEEIDPESPEAFDTLILLLALDDFEVADEERFFAMTENEREAVENWLAARHAAASDNIVRKKDLIQPEFSTAFLVPRKERQ